MRCYHCGKENRDGAQLCRYCGEVLLSSWQPTWRWHLKTLAIIYICLGVLYLFLVHIVLK